MTDFPRPPKLRPPKPPSFAHLINAPLEVASKVIGRFEADMDQISTDLQKFGQPLQKSTFVEPPMIQAPEVTPEPPELSEPALEAVALAKPAKGTACLQCTSDHLSTLVGALNEAMRFARENGVNQEEVQRRLLIATDELNICERIDLAPDKTAALGPKEREVATWVLPQLRSIRHSLKEIGSTEDLELVAAVAFQMRDEYATRYKDAKGE